MKPISITSSWKFLFPLLASSLCFGVQPDRITGPIDSSQTVVLARSVHPKAEPQYDLGAVEPSLRLSYMTLLTVPSPDQQKALDQLLSEQQDRTSPNYHKWLTPEQYADRFGLSQNDVNKITGWLKSQGFTVLSVARGRNAVTFSGTAAQVQSAFRAEIHSYNVNGAKHIANSTPVTVPVALNGIVVGVRGLNDFRPKPRYVRPPRGNNVPGPHPSYTITISGSTYVYLAPGDIATIYDINPLYEASPPINGTGQKLAIMGQTDIYLADLTYFRSGFNLPSFTCTTGLTGLITSCNATNFAYVLLGTDPGSPSLVDLFEADLDVEWAGAVARNAQIIFVNAETAAGVSDALAYAIQNKTALVISTSYGICEAEAAPFQEAEFQMGATEGLTILAPSGDDGAADCDGYPPGTTSTYTPPPPYSPAVGGWAVDYPGSSPEVTSVGGTATDWNYFTSAYWGCNGTNGGSACQYVPEAPWNDDEEFALYCIYYPGGFCDPSPGVPITSAQTFQEDYWISIGGGGVSNCYNQTAEGVCESGFPQPKWQQALTIPDLTSPLNTYRFVPDVALLASPNFPGYIFCTPVEEESTVPSTETTSTCANGIAAAVEGTADIYPSIVGGTSASVQVFGGIVTLLNQYLGGTGLGNINPALYKLAATPSNDAFHQAVTTGVSELDNVVYCEPGTPAAQPASVQCPAGGSLGFFAFNADATTGYNLVTGLGSVDVNNLAVAWAATITPTASFSTSSVFFGTQVLGVSASGALTLTNAGESALTVSSIAIAGANNGDFSLTHNCPISPSTLAVNAVCTIQPAFKPTAIGPRKSSIAIADNSGTGAQTIILTGVGTAISPSPTSLTFTSEPVGTASAAMTVTLTNKSSSSVSLYQIAFIGADAGDFSKSNTSTCGTSLATGANCTINVVFTPGATGARTASLEISHNGGGSPQAVPLSGTGTSGAAVREPRPLSRERSTDRE